nr:hypothetical protein [uncultured Campylobacter sp.]
MDLSAEARYTKFNLKTRRYNVKFDTVSMVFGVKFDYQTKQNSLATVLLQNPNFLSMTKLNLS